MDLIQFKIKYIEDAQELLNKLDDYLIDLEKNPTEKELIESVFRVMHTIKGTSGMYGFDAICELTHELENIYNLVRDGKLLIDSSIISLTLKAADYIRNLLSSDTTDTVTQTELKTQISQILSESENQNVIQKTIIKQDFDEEKLRTWQILITTSEEMIKRSINILYSITDLCKLGDYRISPPDFNDQIHFWSIFLVTKSPLSEIEEALIFLLDYCKIQYIADFNIFSEEELEKRKKTVDSSQAESGSEISPEVHPAISTLDEIQGKFKKNVTTKINVDASKLDHLMFLVSELVTTKSELLLSIENKDNERIIETAQKIDKISKLFRDNALDIRLISMSEMINRFKRLVRDLAQTLGKKVEFETHGEEIELDKNIIETISEPIMHLIRNCIDHGIESPDIRIKNNKPETGIIKLFAFKSGNFVFIQISDDGKGIDKEKIISKAISKGIITENIQLTDKEIYELIFLPGFSTAESLTQVSGRGVGMDIVRKKIQEIRGEINIDSEIGLGTSFTLKLQQTISIIDTLLVQSGNIKIAIPIEDIENCELISENEIGKTQNYQIAYKNELIPYLNLSKEFNQQSALPEKYRAIIIKKHEKHFAILTEKIIGEYQAVIKSLDKTFQEQDFISGASILGDGSIALLLDTDRTKKLIKS